MTNEEQLVSNYEHNRRDKLRSVIADYLSDAGVTAQVIIDEFKAELNSQLDYYRQKVDKVSGAVDLLDAPTGTYPVTITSDDVTLTGAGNTAAYPTASYFVDGHSDIHVRIADTDAQTFNVDTKMCGEVSVASSDAYPAGYYDHDAAGPYYVEPVTTADFTNPNPPVPSAEANPTGYYGTYSTGVSGESTVAVASSMSNPAGMYGTGGVSPEVLAGGEEPEYTGKLHPYNFNTPPDKLNEGDWV